MIRVLGIIVAVLGWIVTYIAIPFLCCVGIIYNTADGVTVSKKWAIRGISFVTFLFFWFISFLGYGIETSDYLDIAIPKLYNDIVSYILPLCILIILVVYIYISGRAKKIAIPKRFILAATFILITDWQFLSLIQIQPWFTTAVRQQDKIVKYELTLYNLTPFLIVNSIAIGTIIVFLIRHCYRQRISVP